MYVSMPATLTEMYIENDSSRNKYTGLLNANFKDYMDSMMLGGQYTFKANSLRVRISQFTSGVGVAAGALGGPLGMGLGYTIGNTIGKYLGSVIGGRIYGQAIEDMAVISHESKIRHAQLAATLAYTNQMDGAIDTLRQNENKRKKDDFQSMQV